MRHLPERRPSCPTFAQCRAEVLLYHGRAKHEVKIQAPTQVLKKAIRGTHQWVFQFVSLSLSFLSPL